jgi:hypothetical protein
MTILVLSEMWFSWTFLVISEISVTLVGQTFPVYKNKSSTILSYAFFSFTQMDGHDLLVSLHTEHTRVVFFDRMYGSQTHRNKKERRERERERERDKGQICSKSFFVFKIRIVLFVVVCCKVSAKIERERKRERKQRSKTI